MKQTQKHTHTNTTTQTYKNKRGERGGAQIGPGSVPRLPMKERGGALDLLKPNLSNSKYYIIQKYKSKGNICTSYFCKKNYVDQK